MSRKIIIGDVHCNYLGIKSIFRKIEYTAKDILIFVGDYIDGFELNGYNARKTIDMIIDIKNNSQNVYTLLGNHDNWMISWIENKDEIPYHGWYSQGGKQTLKSYNIYNPMSYRDVKHLIPISHINFLQSLKVCYFDEEIVVVHGGFQDEDDMIAATKSKITFGILWDRDFYHTDDISLLQYYRKIFGERIFICGHTPNGPYEEQNDVRRFMIDGGSNGGGNLFALIIEDGKHYIVRE